MADNQARSCPHCGVARTVRNGTTKGRQRWRCRGCGRTFGATNGTPLYNLKTDPAEVAQALRVAVRRGSLRGAEAVTGHKYETISAWVRRASAHGEALSERLVHDLHLSEVELDEFWSFVRTKKGARMGTPPTRPAPTVASGGVP